MAHVLIVDDDANTRNALAELIGAQGLTVALAADLRAARSHLMHCTPDMIFTDLQLPDGNGADLLADLETNHGVNMIVITGHATVDSAVQSMKLGAIDYLVKPINLARVQTIIDRIPRRGDLQAELDSLRGALRRFGRFAGMLGQSPAMQALYDQIDKIAPSSASVMLIGESGTGKELAAHTIHNLSRRRAKPFLPINCGAIAPQLIEMEMFGHEQGMLTGAGWQHKGYFEHASGGTLFLDEITAMPIELQVKLLRVLESGVFMRIGAAKEIEVDVRVIAATHRDPEQAVFEGTLRADLYHRLNVFPLTLPPLRERGTDLALLAQHFLDEFNAGARPPKHFSPLVAAFLLQHDWPGNVRELRNYVHRATILASAQESDLALAPQTRCGTGGGTANLTVLVGTSLEAANRELIHVTLEQCDGVKARAAEILGISLKTLYNRLAQYESESHIPNASAARGAAQDDLTSAAGGSHQALP